MNDLDLSSLATAPVPALVPADQVKARGDQRRTRGRLVVAGAALVVLAGAGTAISLTGTGKPDALIPAGPSPSCAPADCIGPDEVQSEAPDRPPSTDRSLDPSDAVEFDHIGPVRVGMSLARAEAAAGQDLRQVGDVLGNCVYYAPRSKTPDVLFMVINDVVSRIEVDSGTTTTSTGIGLGSTEADVTRTHPNAVVSKHPYTDGHYMRVLSEDGRYAFLFETDGTKVTSFRSGYPSAVDRIEGCA
jgi:hypothetical protein